MADDGIFGNEDDNAATFYKYGQAYLCNLFPPEDHRNLLAILASVEEMTQLGLENKRVTTALGDFPPKMDHNLFIVVKNSSKYNALRYMRHEKHK